MLYQSKNLREKRMLYGKNTADKYPFAGTLKLKEKVGNKKYLW
jgi:hypothetical protein